jgi:hypothetical protein
MLTGLMMNVLAFFLLNCILKSFESAGKTQVLGKKLNSSLKILPNLLKFLARLFLRANAWMPGALLIL